MNGFTFVWWGMRFHTFMNIWSLFRGFFKWVNCWELATLFRFIGSRATKSLRLTHPDS